MSSNSVCNHTPGWQIRFLLGGRPVLTITRIITDRIGLHLVLLQLLIYHFVITRSTSDRIRLHSVHLFCCDILSDHDKTQTADCADCEIFLFAFFWNCDYTYDYSFGNVGTVSNFWTPHDEILRGYLEHINLRFYSNACTACVCIKIKRTIFKWPADRTRGSISIVLILPKIENVGQRVSPLVCIYSCLELGVSRGYLVRLKGRRRLR